MNESKKRKIFRLGKHIDLFLGLLRPHGAGVKPLKNCRRPVVVLSRRNVTSRPNFDVRDVCENEQLPLVKSVGKAALAERLGHQYDIVLLPIRQQILPVVREGGKGRLRLIRHPSIFMPPHDSKGNNLKCSKT